MHTARAFRNGRKRLAANKKGAYARGFFDKRDKRTYVRFIAVCRRTVYIAVSSYIRHAFANEVAKSGKPVVIKSGIESHDCKVGIFFR